MPIIGTRGSFSAAGFGLGLFSKVVQQGPLGIFTSRVYNFTDDTVTTQASLPASSSTQGATSNTSIAIAGISGATTTKIQFSNFSRVAGSSLGFTQVSGSSAGNKDLGLFTRGLTAVGGSPTNTTNIYAYAGDIVSGGSNLATTSAKGAAVGPSDFMINAVGSNSSGFGTTTTNKYTYASGAVAVSTAFTAAIINTAAAGNANVGIWSRSAVSATNKFTFSSSVTATSGALANVPTAGNACGSDTTGYFASNTATTKYDFASDGAASGAALPNASSSWAVSNGTTGVNK